jgi:(p)ppGpp synthase/HD superfamily hydrolase
MSGLSQRPSQQYSLQLSTSLALDQGLDDIHDLVKQHENALESPGFIKDMKHYFLKASRREFFGAAVPGEELLCHHQPLLEQALQLAANRHLGEYRDSGHPYLAHVLSTGFLMARLGFPVEVVLAGILHDSVEDTADKNQVLNALHNLHPAVAWYVFSVSGPDLQGAVEKDKHLLAKIHDFSARGNNIYPKAIKCFDSMANLYDLESMHAKDGRKAIERQRLFLDKTNEKILPLARELDTAGCIRVKKGRERFSAEEFLADMIEDKRQIIENKFN